MGSVNINRHVSDQFYRYKMPRLIAKVEGKGNGIKTVIVNMVDIAKALNRPPTYPTKYFGCELGAQTQFDLKNDRYIVNGSHEAGRLQEMLDGFIKKFVLCPECDNPETFLAISQKKQMITQQCIACGHSGNIDMRHKLTTFILKNPPSQEAPVTPGSVTPGSGKKKEKKDKSKKHNGEHNGSVSPTSPTPGDPDESIPAPARVSSEEEDDWGEDTSEDAVIRRMEALTDGVKSLTLNDDLEKSQQERLDILYNFVKKRLENNKLEGSDKDILAEAERLDVRDKGPLILVELLFDENMLQQINKHRILFLRFTHGNPKAQKYLLGGFEQLVGKMHKDTLLPKVAFLLKALYDADILDEEVILDWAKKMSKKYVNKQVAQEIHDKAAPFIKWLNEAEEEPSSSDADDSEEEEDLPARAPHKPVALAKKDDEVDIDIDAI